MDGYVHLVVPSLSTTFIKNSQKNLPVQYSGQKLDMLFEIAKSVEIVIILGKKLFYPKFLISCKTLFCCYLCPHKGPVKLIKRVTIAHSFLQSVSNLFNFIILSLPMQFYIWLSKNILKAASKTDEIGCF